jgi:DNA gyrase subunit B
MDITDRSGQSVRLTEARLQRFQRTLKEYEGWGSKLKEQFGAVAVTYVKDHRLVERPIDSLDALEAYFAEEVPDEEPHRAEVLARREDSLVVKISEKATGASRLTEIPLALFSSAGYQSLRSTHDRLMDAAGAPPFGMRMQKRDETVHTWERFRPTLLSLAQEGLNLQRFKGLGEMNPEQLWDTTMNPEHRVLQRVSVEDAATADLVFSTLMGDQVEPRRDFIERNARDVKFLDI